MVTWRVIEHFIATGPALPAYRCSYQQWEWHQQQQRWVKLLLCHYHFRMLGTFNSKELSDSTTIPMGDNRCAPSRHQQQSLHQELHHLCIQFWHHNTSSRDHMWMPTEDYAPRTPSSTCTSKLIGHPMHPSLQLSVYTWQIHISFIIIHSAKNNANNNVCKSCKININ